jgi:hypothetical protein
MNKRGGYAQPVVDIFVTILIIMIIIVFYMMFKWTVAVREYNIKQNAATMDGSTMLYAILRAPVSASDPKDPGYVPQTVGEYLQRDRLFSASGLNPSLNPQVYKVIKPTIEEYSELTGCEIKLMISQGTSSTKEPMSFGESKESCSKKSFEAVQLIPRPDGAVEVKLLAGETSEYLRIG